MKSKWIFFKGKKILYADYSGFKGDAAALQIENDAVDAVVCQQAPSSVLCITDVRDTLASSEAMVIIKNSAKRTNPYIRKQAVIGVTGVRRVLADAVVRFSGQNLSLFDSMEQAQEWLVSD
ncbi:MAG TPA: hypothetical protein VMU29_13280 [Smithella sp.]|nr:hypothetical protein [Smithella sp.]